ncbi:MAG: hypothetical protein HFG09_02325 [Oscillibacter sp.]|nr:hypothetical protein [Oscillibacter sp.]
MTCAAMYDNQMMSRNASASCANAASSCAVMVILDAVILASIIIFAGLSVLVVFLVLVALLYGGKVNDAPWARGFR